MKNQSMQKNSTKFASFSQRLMAHLCDSLILSFIPLLGSYFFISATSLADGVYRLTIAVFFILLPSSIFNLIYHGWFLANKGATPGKKIWGVEIVDDGGEHLSFWRAVSREYLGKPVSGFFLGLGFLWVLRDKQGRTWHDMLFGSIAKKSDEGWNGWLATLLLLGSAVFLVFRISNQLPEFGSLMLSQLLEG